MSRSTAIRSRLFLISYAPLAAILAVTHSHKVWPPQNHLPFWIAATIAAWGVVDGYRLPRGLRAKSSRSVTLRDIHDEGAAVAAYIATYLLPFLGFEITDWRGATGLALYLLVLLVVFLQTDLALVNPTLYVTGWKVASGTWNDRRILLLLPAGCSVAEETQINVVTMDVFFILDEGTHRDGADVAGD